MRAKPSVTWISRYGSLLSIAYLCALPLSGQTVWAPGQTVQLFVGCYGWPGGQPASCYVTVNSFAWTYDNNGHTAAQHSNPFPSSAMTMQSGGPWYHNLG